MKVAFYLNNGCYSKDQDYRNVLCGNPGIGGTEYEFLLLSNALTARNNGLCVYLYVEQEGIFDDELNIIVEPHIERAAIRAAEDGCSCFVMDSKQVLWHENPFNEVPNGLRIIPWCHCFSDAWHWRQMGENSHVGRIICVGSEQADLYRDDMSFDKTDYIFNGVSINNEFINLARANPNINRSHIVTYVGSLTRSKTFHVLAEIWPEILKRVPDAELNVIGNAGLYFNVDQFGEFGLAEKSYEDTFMKYLSKDGKILESVHFLGKMGVEKNQVLLKTKVGVPNPTGRSETFCLTAVEMQLMGCSVTAMQAPGYFDTIYNGKVVHGKNNLMDSIVELLVGGPPKMYDDTVKFMINHYSVDVIAREWEIFLKGGMNCHLHPIKPMKNVFYRLKWLKEFLRQCKIIFPILNKYKFTVEGYLSNKEKNIDDAYRLI